MVDIDKKLPGSSRDVSRPSAQPDVFSLQRLASLAYSTPFLLMDPSRLRLAYRRLVGSLPGIHIHYAMKCNPHPGVLKTLHDLGCQFEIASYVELEMLMAIGVDPADVLYSNPVKPRKHLVRAAQAGVWRYAVDSIGEIQQIARYAPGAAVYVRLATQVEDSLVHSEGKFGVDPAAAEQLLLQAREAGLRPYGLAFHVSGQKLSARAWEVALADCAAIMRRLSPRGITLEMVDMGGGLPAAYADFEPDLAAFGRVITRAAHQLLPYPVRVVAEPGRALAAEAGVMVATVIGRAERGGKQWLHLDVGAFNGLMEALETGNQLRFPVTDELCSAEQQLFHLTGPSCDAQDTILFDVPLSANLNIGDRVFIGSAGAYTTVYASTFNGFDIPKTYCAQ